MRKVNNEIHFIIKSDMKECFLKFSGVEDVTLKLFVLDILRIMEILKSSGNMYYYSELRWFVNQIADLTKVKIDYDRKLPRIKLKEKRPWELEAISRKASLQA